MTAGPVCSTCGTALPEGAAGGICPRCALRSALEISCNPPPLFNPAALLATPAEGDHAPFEDYDQFNFVARGGMGVVYRAHQISLDRVVAVKMILAGHSASEAEMRRFRTEASAAAKLHHPNIVAVHEVGQNAAGQYYFSMDYVEGEDLGKLVQRGPLAPIRAAELVRTIAEAVHYAHECGVLHRDLKPSNVLLDRECQPRVTDFGLARLSSAPGQTLTGEILGTPGFIAPEQAAGKRSQMNRTVDVYSLGAILFHLLTGRPPFHEDTPQKTMAAALAGKQISPRSVMPSLSRDLETICLKCLEPEPERRYSTAIDLADELGRFLRGEPIRARPISRFELLWRWSKRNPVASVSSVLVALSIVTAFVILAVSRARIAESRAAQSTQLARLRVSEGWRLVDDGDMFAALVPFAEALRLEENDPQREQMHRSRIGSLLQKCPQLVRMWSAGGTLKHLELSSDGTKVLTACGALPGGHGGVAQVWDLETTTRIGQAMTHESTVLRATFSQDGTLVATASADSTARIWDSGTGRPVSPLLVHPTAVADVAFSPNGRLVATCCPCWGGNTNGYAFIWDIKSGAILNRLETFGRDAQKVWFPPEGDSFWIGSATYLCERYPLTNNERSAKIPSCWSTYDAVYSPDKTHLLIAGAFGPDMFSGARLFDARTFEPVSPFLSSGTDSPFEHQRSSLGRVTTGEGPTLSGAFSPDGRLIATGGSDGTVRLWTRDGRPFGVAFGHRAAVLTVKFSPDGQFLLTAGRDHTARLWDVQTAIEAGPPLRHSDAVCNAEFATAGKRIVTGSEDGFVRVWSTEQASTSQFLFHATSAVRWARFRPDGRHIVTCEQEGAVQVWDFATTKPLGRPLRHAGNVLRAEFSPDGTKLLVLFEPSHAQVWAGKDWQDLGRPFFNLQSAEWGPDSRHLLTANYDHVARIWDGETGLPVTDYFSAPSATELKSTQPSKRQPNATLSGANIVSPVFVAQIGVGAHFSPDGRRVAVCQDSPIGGFVIIYDVATQKAIARPLLHAAGINEAVFSPNGQLIATASGDGTARIWLAETGQPTTPPLKHLAPVKGAMFSPDGKLLVTYGDESSAWLWQVGSAQPIAQPLPHSARVSDACFDATGSRVATCSYDDTARVWDAATGEPLTPPLRHAGKVYSVEFSRDGRWLLTASEDQTARAWPLPTTKIPSPDLAALAGILGGAVLPSVSNPNQALWSRFSQSYSNEATAFASRKAGVSSNEKESDLVKVLLNAQTAEARSDWNQAIIHLTKLLELEPDRWDTLLRRGHAHMQLSDWAAAEIDFSKAIRNKTNAAVPRLERALVRSCLKLNGDALQDIRDAVEIPPRFRHPLIRFGIPASMLVKSPYEMGRLLDDPNKALPATAEVETFQQWESLRSDCLKLLNSGSSNAPVICVRGVVEGSQGQWLPARFDFNLATSLLPNDATPYLLEALAIRAYYRNPDPESWTSVYKSAAESVELSPKNALGWLLAGEAAEQLRENDRALSDYARASELGADSPLLRRAMANIHLQLGQWPEALHEMERSLTQNQNDLEGTCALAWMLSSAPEDTRDSAKALQLARSVCRNHPGEPQALNALALALYRCEKLKEALRQLENAAFIEGSDPDPATLTLLAMCYFRLEQSDKAHVYRSRALATPYAATPKPLLANLFSEADHLFSEVRAPRAP